MTNRPAIEQRLEDAGSGLNTLVLEAVDRRIDAARLDRAPAARLTEEVTRDLIVRLLETGMMRPDEDHAAVKNMIRERTIGFAACRGCIGATERTPEAMLALAIQAAMTPSTYSSVSARYRKYPPTAASAVSPAPTAASSLLM